MAQNAINYMNSPVLIAWAILLNLDTLQPTPMRLYNPLNVQPSEKNWVEKVRLRISQPTLSGLPICTKSPPVLDLNQSPEDPQQTICNSTLLFRIDWGTPFWPKRMMKKGTHVRKSHFQRSFRCYLHLHWYLVRMDKQNWNYQNSSLKNTWNYYYYYLDYKKVALIAFTN